MKKHKENKEEILVRTMIDKTDEAIAEMYKFLEKDKKYEEMTAAAELYKILGTDMHEGRLLRDKTLINMLATFSSPGMYEMFNTIFESFKQVLN